MHGEQRLFVVDPRGLFLLRELLLQRRQLLVRLVDRGLLAEDLVMRPVLELTGLRTVMSKTAARAREGGTLPADIAVRLGLRRREGRRSRRASLRYGAEAGGRVGGVWSSAAVGCGRGRAGRS